MKHYSTLAISLLSTVVFFVALNLVFQVGIVVQEKFWPEPDRVSRKYGDALLGVYPGMGAEEVKALLRETWNRPFIFEPYTQFSERPFSGKYVNVTKEGYRVIRKDAPWPPDPKAFNVFVFGGSTTFGYGLPDDQTIPAYLMNQLEGAGLKTSVQVYNFGRGHYYSTQERLLFEKLLLSGLTPQLAIFVDGLNDFFYGADTPLFTAELSEAVNQEVPEYKDATARNFVALAKKLPLYVTLKKLKRAWLQSHPLPAPPIPNEESYNDSVAIGEVIGRYLRNKEMIEAIGRTFKVKTAFVVQPVPTYRYDVKNHLFAKAGFAEHTHSKFGYPKLRAALEKNRRTSPYVWCADLQEKLAEPLYVDLVHYTAKMSERIARCIFNGVFTAHPGPLK